MKNIVVVFCSLFTVICSGQVFNQCPEIEGLFECTKFYESREEGRVKGKTYEQELSYKQTPTSLSLEVKVKGESVEYDLTNLKYSTFQGKKIVEKSTCVNQKLILTQSDFSTNQVFTSYEFSETSMGYEVMIRAFGRKIMDLECSRIVR